MTNDAYSVVIPAHNEANVIKRGLDTLLQGLPAGCEVVVVCNGCKDDTAIIAGSTGDERIQVLDTTVASKSNALNLGDEAVTLFPRFYLDADIEITGDDLCKIARVLNEDETGCLAAAPAIRIERTDRPWAVRAYYDIWTRLPYMRKTMGGSGVYGLSETGRARFARFPDITADDDFVRLNFAPDETSVVHEATSVVKPPTTLTGIITIMTRSHFGILELCERHPELMKNLAATTPGSLFQTVRSPLDIPKLAVYVYARLIARRRGKQRLMRKDYDTWERDDTSRIVEGATSSTH